jgi:hypothetical protein
MPQRRFPPPWSVDEADPELDRRCFIVRDGNGQALAYVYFEDEPGRQAAAHRGPAHRREHREAAGAAAQAAADKRGVTRLEPHISRQSAQCRLRPQVRKYRRNALSGARSGRSVVALGDSESLADQATTQELP